MRSNEGSPPVGFWETLSTILETAREKTLGAALDALGRMKARRDEAVFSIALIALSAKMAKADGVVTDDEIAAFGRFFSFEEAEADKVRMVYRLAQQDVAGFDHYVAQVARIFEDAPSVLEDVLDCLFHVALADGIAHPSELALLENAARGFGLGDAVFRRVKAANMGLGDDDPFAILGLEPSAGDAEIKAQYRNLLRETHPDVLRARGVPDALLSIAEARAAAINVAYEAIVKERAGRG